MVGIENAGFRNISHDFVFTIIFIHSKLIMQVYDQTHDHGIVLHIKMVLEYNFFVLYLAPILCGLEIKASNIFIFYCSMLLVKLFLVAGHIHTQLAINSKNISIFIHSAPLKNFIKC